MSSLENTIQPENVFNIDFFDTRLSSDLSRNYLSKLYLQQITKNSTNIFKNMGTYTNQYVENIGYKDIIKLLPFNGININEYKFVTECSRECIKVFSGLFNCKDMNGQYTVGSSEAITIALINFLHVWKSKAVSTNKPKILIGHNSHTIISYLAKILNIEIEYIECNSSLYKLNTELISEKLTSDIIGIILTLGNTYTGEIDDIGAANKYLDDYYKACGIKIPIHVDAASGGFIVPFLKHYEIWDFRLDYVQSINVSSHKYGFTYPTLGWYLSRTKNKTEQEIANKVDYLQGQFSTTSINFSHPIYNLIIQYYNFIRYGYQGYTNIVNSLLELKEYLVNELSAISNINIIDTKTQLPVINFTILNSTSKTNDLCKRLIELGWSIPVYPIKNYETHITRIVIRHGMTKKLCNKLIKDIKKAL